MHRVQVNCRRQEVVPVPRVPAKVVQEGKRRVPAELQRPVNHIVHSSDEQGRGDDKTNDGTQDVSEPPHHALPWSGRGGATLLRVANEGRRQFFRHAFWTVQSHNFRSTTFKTGRGLNPPSHLQCFLDLDKQKGMGSSSRVRKS